MSSTALVTGGGGFLATQIILLLVERGFRVRSSVRSPEKGAAWLAKQVVKYPQLASQLEFVIVEDMEKEGSFDEAVKGCDVVFHTASPFHFNFTDNEKEMLIPAREGALNCLRAAAKEPKVKRLIFTSSFAAVTSPHLDPRPGHVYTEKDWNPSTWKESVVSTDPHFVYLASKTFAERAVWKFVEDEKPSFSVTSIVPPIILGEAAQSFTSMADINQSSRVLWRLLDAEKIPGTPAYVCVDVKDCALCHVLAAEKDISVVNGKRYLTIGSSFTQSKASRVIAELFPAVAHRLAKPIEDPPYYSYSSAPAEKDLGIKWRPFQVTVRETFAQILEVEGSATS